MRRPASPAARRALALYDDAPRGDRFHVRFRWWTCPFDAIEAQVPASGRVLEVGCGHGLLSLFLALSSPQRSVSGVDIDEHKIALARRAVAHLRPGEADATFATVEPAGFAEGRYDAIVIADVLYLLGAAARQVLLQQCVDHLDDGGVLLVKETDRLPRWKGAITVAQERLATGVLRITEGDEVEFAPPAELAAPLVAAGLDVTVERVDRGYLHPHVLIIARRAAQDRSSGGAPPRSGRSGSGSRERSMSTANPEALGVEVQPDDAYFDLMAEVAETHWWYRARRAWLRQELGPHLARGERAIDIGCGTGDAVATLAELGADPVAGTDLSEHVLEGVVRQEGAPAVLRSLAEQLPFADRCAATLISMDVIEHLDDDVVALREYRRLLRPGATVLLTVPAYQWIWSEHDDRAAHRRRYSRQRLVVAVKAAGFEVDRVTYLFSFLVPLAAVVRKTPLRRFFPATDEETSAMHPAIEKVLALLATIERRIGAHVDLPFGLSILLVGHVPDRAR